MKIGIISMQRVRNYGSFLQAYALKRLIEALGHHVSFVDIEASDRRSSSSSGKSPLGYLRHVDRYLIKRLWFRKKRPLVSRMYRDAQKKHLKLEDGVMSAEGCDAVVIGSDEIFNCDSKGPWKITSQRFGYIPTAEKVISYAASCGYSMYDDIDDHDKSVIQQGLEGLDAISVRDDNTAKVVDRIGGMPAEKHADPVLVYDFAEETDGIPSEKLPKKPYMLVYAYRGRIHSREEIGAIRAYAKEHGLRIVSVGGVQAWCDEYVVPEPFEVLAYFKNAECVVTDTFHGTIMSAKYNKPFAVFVRENNTIKLEDLLAWTHIEEHAVRDPADLAVILNRSSDYSRFNEVVKRERLRTEAFLGEHLTEKR